MFRAIIAMLVMTAAGVHAAQPAVPPAKQELVQRVLQLWHLDNLGQTMLQRPVGESVQQARAMLQATRVSADRRDAAMRDIAEEARKFMAETAPVMHGSAQKLAASTVGPILAERFTEDELRQIIAMLDSPVRRKFEALAPEMEKALGEKIAEDTRAVITPKLSDLNQRINAHLRTAVAP